MTFQTFTFLKNINAGLFQKQKIIVTMSVKFWKVTQKLMWTNDLVWYLNWIN